MMKRTLIACLVLTGVLTLTAVAQKSTTSKSNAPEALLGEAIHQEEAEGNLEAAIAAYKKVISEYGNNRPLAAKAQLHLGLAYEKLGNAEARKAYEQVVRNYADQPEVAADARRHLAVLEGVRSSETLAVRHLYTTRDDYPASLTPDGRFIGVSDGSKVGIREMATGQTRWLTEDDPMLTEPECTILSPDQRQVVYAWYPSRNGVMYGEVRLIANETGSKPRILIAGSEDYKYVDPLAWSPDGKSILIEISRRDQTWQLGWVSVADGTIKVLKSLQWRLPKSASLSPDGKYIAYSTIVTNPSHPIGARDQSLDSAGVRIYILAADGSTETELTKDTAINRSPIWTPDGGHILFTSDRYGSIDLWSVPIQKGKAAGTASLVKRNFNGFPIGITRSGSFYYSESLSSVDQIFVAENGRQQGSEPLLGLFPTLSPDGKLIAFLNKRGKSAEVVRIVHSFDTGEDKVYAHPGMLAVQARWLSDSTGFLETIRNENGADTIYRVDWKTGEFKQVIAFKPSPTHGTIGMLAPDDKTLYVGDSGTSTVAIDLSSGQQKAVFKWPATGKLAAIALVEEGRRLALTLVDNKDVYTLASVSVDGSDYRELYSWSQHAVGVQVASAGAGKGILFSMKSPDVPWRIMRISATGGTPEFTGVESDSIIRWFNSNKDGSRLAYSSNQSKGGGVALAGWDVFSMDNVMPVLKAAK
jgi:Tol biopolymer transport system component